MALTSGKVKIVKYIDTIVGPLRMVDVPKPPEVPPEKKLCRRCGRVLKDEESIQKGFGRTCYKKFLAEQPQQIPLFQRKTV